MGAFMLRRVILAGVSTCVLGLTFGFSQSANAQTATGFTSSQIATNSCWIDAATGNSVPTGPFGWSPTGTSSLDSHGFSNPDPNHVSTPRHTYVRLDDGSWTDAATGNPVPTGPFGWSPTGTSSLDSHGFSNPDPNHVSTPRHSYVRIPCPPPSTASSTVGGYIGGELVKNWGWVRSTERLATTDVITNRFTDTADPLGGGLIVGYKFAPWAN